jgi:hypothetical protein
VGKFRAVLVEEVAAQALDAALATLHRLPIVAREHRLHNIIFEKNTLI